MRVPPALGPESGETLASMGDPVYMYVAREGMYCWPLSVTVKDWRLRPVALGDKQVSVPLP